MPTRFSTPRVAICHYWLVANRGGERVLERLCAMFPQADIFTHVHDRTIDFGPIGRHSIRETFVGRLPFARRLYQHYLPLMPFALEQLDLTGYDLILSSEAGPAKGAVRHPDARQVCYVHSPMRYIWDQYTTYRANFGAASRLASPFLFSRLRLWDFVSAQRVDRFIANSAFVGRRIEASYRRQSDIVHPPVDVDAFAPVPASDIEDHYLWVGQLVPYKRPELAVDACTRLGRNLVVVGQGGMLDSLRKRAGPTIRFVPRLPHAELCRMFARCRALLFTGEEDFGITPVEVIAAGRPVLALGRGGALETVVDGETGGFFATADVDCLTEAIERFEAWLPGFDPIAARRSAERFRPERFDEGMRAILAEEGF